MCSLDEDLRLYGQLFRATGDARPISAERPITADDPVSVCPGIDIGDFAAWLAGPLSAVCQGYSIATRSCQHFSLDLRDFLAGKRGLEDLQLDIHKEAEAVWHGTMRDYRALDFASERLKSSRELRALAGLQALLFGEIAEHQRTEAGHRSIGGKGEKGEKGDEVTR